MKRVLKRVGEFLLKFILIMLGVLILGTIGLSIFGYIKYKPTYDEYVSYANKVVSESDPKDFKSTATSYIYYADKSLMAELKSDKDTIYLEYKEIPEYAINAFIAVEDRTFWENPGYDTKGIARVLINYVLSNGEEKHGASTITQQLVKNVYLTSEKSLERKAKEILIAKAMTEKYTKEQIIEFYINDIYYANGYYGIGAASKGYFGTDVSELSLSQIAFLCAIPNSPTYYDPRVNMENTLVRRDKILDDMLELGFISQTSCSKAKAEEIEIISDETVFNNYETTYAVHCAVEYLMQLDGFDFKYDFSSNGNDYDTYKEEYDEEYALCKGLLYSGGYKIYTTIMKDKQEELQAIINEKLSFDTNIDDDTNEYELQSALTVIDNQNYKVVAIIGGRTNEENSERQVYSLNRAFQSYRQPGSTIKPLIDYTPSLENGMTPESSVKNISISSAKALAQQYTKTHEYNIDVLSGDTMTMRSALEQSKNGVAWYLYCKNGVGEGIKKLVNMQFSKIVESDYYESASIGGLTYGVTTVEMASAYSALENHGDYEAPTCIISMKDSNNTEIFEDSKLKHVYDPDAADLMVDMMTGVLTRGTAAKLKWYSDTDMVAACKTGTTNDSKDGWLCGFTPMYTISVWVGYDEPRTLNDLYGATYPGQIWKSAMLNMIEGYEPTTEFEKWSGFEYPTETKSSSNNTETNTTKLEDWVYEKYLPGVDDATIISDGYTAYDYRCDMLCVEQIDKILAVVESYYNLYTSGELDLASYTQYEKSLYKQDVSQLVAIKDSTLKNEQTQKSVEMFNKLGILEWVRQ